MKKYTYYGSSTSDATIIYLHGGGYVMGDQHDLPVELSDLLSANFNLITLDYPLAPQLGHIDIVDYVEQEINILIKNYNIKNLILMGRSSGSNLIMSMIPDHLTVKPKAIVSFYGYASTDTSWLTDAIKGLDFPVSEELVNTINNSSETVYSRNLEATYPYYYSLRKNGQWPLIINFKQRELLWDKDIPIFIAHSIFDTDVPFKAALELRKHFSNHKLYTSQSKKHAFDHDSDELSKLLIELQVFFDSLF